MRKLAISAGLLLLASVSDAQTMLAPGQGAVEFTATLRDGGTLSFLHPEIIFSAAASDGSERVEIKVAGTDLLAIREVKPCLRQSARIQDMLRRGVPQHVHLRWNHASAKLALEGREEPLELSVADRLPTFASGGMAAGSRNVEVRALSTTADTSLPESSADRRFFEQSKCFDPRNAAATALVTEVYRGVELRNFQDAAAARDAVRRWIDASTPDMLSALRSVALTDSGSQTWRGLSIPGEKTMLLRPGIATEPRIYFHEMGHLVDGMHGWRDSHDWALRFMNLPASMPNFSPGALGHLDASSPGEQLAETVGLAKTEALGLAHAHMCAADENCASKMSFLAGRGFLTAAEASSVATQTAPLASRKAVRASEAASLRIPAPNPSYKTETIVPPPGATRIDIVLDRRWFVPIDIYRNGGSVVAPTWRGCKADDVMNRLVRNKPAAVVFEPPLKAGTRKYGYFDFGSTKHKRHYLALDELPDGSIVMHFDMKGNGRLDNTLAKMGKFHDGEKAFATLIEFPWSEVADGATFDGVVKLWFMSNAFEWAIAGFSKSNHTQLLGHIQLDGQTYDLIVADTAISDNDGDFSNDGLCLRKPGQKAACWKDAEVKAGVDIDGKRYAFNVSLPGSGR